MKEASTRGIELREKKGDFIIQFGKIEGKKSASCKPNYRPKIITIDSLTWKFINPAQKETLIFHELAHCLLLRQHNNGAFEFGECKSWMRADESSCHVNLHNSAWREYYLDELFSPSSVPVPYWYRSKPHSWDRGESRVAQSVKIPPLKFIYFDSVIINNYNDWIIDITGVKPRTGHGAIALRINEVVLETSFAISGNDPNRQLMKSRMVVIYNEPRRIALESVSDGTTVKLSVQKIGHTVLVYFGNALRYIYPVGASRVKVGAYCSFPEGYNSINLYVL